MGCPKEIHIWVVLMNTKETCEMDFVMDVQSDVNFRKSFGTVIIR